MTVAHILQQKGADVVSVDSSTTVEAVARLLAEHKIGAVLIMDNQNIAGILSERDIVRAIAAHGNEALAMTAQDIMTKSVVTCAPMDAIADVMGQMTQGRFRHLPVMEQGSLAGLISIGDVVKQRIAETEQEAEALREYITTG